MPSYRSAGTFLSLVLTTTLRAQQVTITPSEKGLRIEVDGALFTEYVTKDTQHPCFYPVIGPSGAGLTREYPPAPGAKVDHPHHSSIWIGHDGVNGVNFWYIWGTTGSIQTTALSDRKAEGNSASFHASSKWVTSAGEAVLRDERQFVITALPRGARQIDVKVTFLASEGDVTFRDSKEGTMGIRVAPTMTASPNKLDQSGGGGHILTSEGATDAAAWGTRAKWVAYYGPDPRGQLASITMMDHPSNLRHPTWWHVRAYGLFAANPFGQSDFEAPRENEKAITIGGRGTKGNFTLTKGQSLTQRYRILLQSGPPNTSQLDSIFTSFQSDQ